VTDEYSRINGWKAIARHFGRHRATAIRWSQSGAFPVRRLRGRKGASVWAYAHELDAWLASGGAELAANGAPSEPVPHAALPADPALADRYLQARDDLAARTPADLNRAMAGFAAVASRDPGFAPAYAGLADAYLLAPEFDGAAPAASFAAAEAAAKAALAVDPQSADAHRALGFVAYWGRGDIGAARTHLAMSLRSEPHSSQTHHWLGNILSDIGEDADGLTALRTARRLSPGSRAIVADYAWALWRHGPGDVGVAELEALAASSPASRAAHVYLAFIRLTNGDAASYVAHREQVAAFYERPEIRPCVELERAAYEAGGAEAVLDLVVSSFTTWGANSSMSSEWPATAAAVAGRRSELLDLLALAEARGEYWKPWREDQARLARWRDDAAVREALQRLIRPPPRLQASFASRA